MKFSFHEKEWLLHHIRKNKVTYTTIPSLSHLAFMVISQDLWLKILKLCTPLYSVHSFYQTRHILSQNIKISTVKPQYETWLCFSLKANEFYIITWFSFLKRTCIILIHIFHFVLKTYINSHVFKKWCTQELWSWAFMAVAEFTLITICQFHPSIEFLNKKLVEYYNVCDTVLKN